MAGRRVSPQELIQLQSKPEVVRNVCIIAHVDHGKTTLSDSLVSSNGVISAKLAGKLRYLDSTEDEQQRGITMKSSAISLLHTKEDRPRLRRLQMEEAARAAQAATTTTTASTSASLPTPPSQPPPSTPMPPAPPEGTGPSTQGADGGGDAAPAPIKRDYLINLIDSPGHIDFSSDVSTATRLSDGAIVVVDVLEGVCTQTHAVLRQAWNERMKPCLVLNKVDRLVLELKLTPLEAFWHLQRVLERVNAISSSLITSEVFRLDKEETYGDELEKEWLFCPERGNVVFASSLYCWAFSISTFAKIWAKKLNCKRVMLQRHLWGDFIFNPKAMTVTRYTPESKAKPMFVSMILDPIWQLYDVTVCNPDLDKAAKMAKRLDLEVPPRELNSKDSKATSQSIFRRWLPLAEAVLDMVVDVVPDPATAQRRRVMALWPPDPVDNIDIANGSNGSPSSDGVVTPQEIESVHTSLSTCSTAPDAPVIVYVSKMVSVRAADLTDYHQQASSSDGQEVLVAFARVFSGVLHPDTPLYIMGPKYHPLRRHHEGHIKKVPPGTRIGLYMMMGTSLQAITAVPAGNLVAIGGLDGLVLKSATLASNPACPGLTSMTLQAKPMVRVAVEAVQHSDMDALERGLAKLYQADPAVEVLVQENGEHVIATLGELHLEQCLKDLRERYARVELRASAPLVAFKETVAASPSSPITPGTGTTTSEAGGDCGKPPQLTVPPWCEEEGVESSSGGVCRLSTPAGDCTLVIRCLPLPGDMAKLMDSKPQEVRELLSELRGIDDSSKAQGQDDQLPLQRRTSRLGSHVSHDGSQSFRHQMEDLLGKDTDTITSNPLLSPDSFFNSLLACGPRNMGPNVLLKSPGARVKFVVVETKQKKEGEEQGVEEVVEVEVLQEANELRDRVWRVLENSIMTGFQMATASGPLAEEAMYGVCFVVDEVVVRLLSLTPTTASEDQGSEWLTSRLGTMSGQAMSCCKSACRAAFLSCPVRLVEALYKCDLQCDRNQLGKLYGVLSRRRGRVIEEDIIEGTDLFIITALLPVAESFGFANELLKKTSGAGTSPQLAFSHWEQMELDPFWRPLNEDDREEFGEVVTDHVNLARKYIDDTRKRKGLQVGEKIVIHAEKQRTLKKNK